MMWRRLGRCARMLPVVAVAGGIAWTHETAWATTDRHMFPALSGKQLYVVADQAHEENAAGWLADALQNARVEGKGDAAELYWREARAARLASLDESLSKQERQAWAMRCLECANKAVEADPQNWTAHKWRAVALKVVGDYQGTKEKLMNAYEIRDEFTAALELNPGDPTTLCLMGQWCFFFANMAWYERSIASALFASPPSSSYEEALTYFIKAENLQPGFYKKNAQMLAQTYAALGKTEEAREWKAKTLAMPTKTPDDKQAHEAAEKLSV